tara:strand:+ start:711 stop:860 length:150 start_codon:yes stop_codon:yes gene_type:complete
MELAEPLISYTGLTLFMSRFFLPFLIKLKENSSLNKFHKKILSFTNQEI